MELTLTMKLEAEEFASGVEAAFEGCLDSLEGVAEASYESGERDQTLVVQLVLSGAEYETGVTAGIDAWAAATEGIVGYELS